MRNYYVKNGLVVGVILSFIGVGIQPAFAEVSIKSDNSELVEIIVKIYKPSRFKQHKIMLTKEQVDDLDNHFDNFKVKLDNALTKRETADIYNEMIVSLDGLDLLPDYMTVDEAQKLVTGKNYLFLNNRIASKLSENSNFFCLISGQASNTGFPLWFIPIHIGGIIIIGVYIQPGKNPISPPYHGPAEGWVKTYGFQGLKEWNGTFIGDIFNIAIPGPFCMFIKYYFGAVGFIGIAIEEEGENTSFIGFAPWVKIKYK